jgi:WD40 repeat protein
MASEILYLSTNQNQTALSCGTQTGFIIFSLDPLRIRFKQDFGKGIGICEVYYNSNIVALVGGGDHPMFPKNKCVMFDHYQRKMIWDFETHHDVLGVRFNKDYMVVLTETDIRINRFKDVQEMLKIKTAPNPLALMSISVNKKYPIILSPDRDHAGSIRITNYESISKQFSVVKCHDSNIKLVAQNLEATKFATCSERGTLIRVFDAETGNKLKEFRRGSDQTDLYNICFSKDSKYLASTSSKGTIHVFSMTDTSSNSSSNETSSLGFLGSVVPFLGSEWSMFKVAHKAGVEHLAVPLLSDEGVLDRLVVVDYSGNYALHKLDCKNKEVYEMDSGDIFDLPMFTTQTEKGDEE